MLPVKSIASDLSDILTSKTIDGTIHSVFDQACNIQLDEHNLITFISSELPDYPSAIKLNIAQNQKLSSLGFKKGMKVFLNKDEIRIPDISFSIKLTGAKIWDSSPLFARSKVSEEVLKKNIKDIRKLTLEYGKIGGMASVIIVEKCVNNSYKDFVIESIEKLESGIKHFDCKTITEASNGLIGFGPGLTPAADDFLLGVMASLYYIGKYFGNHLRILKKITGSIIINFHGRTTLVSEVILRNGSKARFSELIKDLMLALVNKTTVYEECINLINTGETSGSDIISGIVFGGLAMLDLKQFKGKRENVCKIPN